MTGGHDVPDGPGDGPLRLLLVRHGRTAANVRKELDTRPPGAPLDRRGLAQADALAARLATAPVSAVHASVATRAQQTAAPVAAAHGLPVTVLAGVHEVFCGELEGQSDPPALERFGEVYTAWWAGALDARLPGGESALDVRARFLPAVDRITATATGAVVLVSHGAAIRLVAGALLGDGAETAYVPNTGVVTLGQDPAAPAGWRLAAWDDAAAVAGDVTAGGAAR